MEIMIKGIKINKADYEQIITLCQQDEQMLINW